METPAVRDKLSTAFRVQPVISARIFSFIVPAIGFQPFLLVRLDDGLTEIRYRKRHQDVTNRRPPCILNSIQIFGDASFAEHP